jgi:hypothetical protein
VESALDVQLTFDDMCGTGTAAQCRSCFVILTLHGYATHAILEIPEKKHFMYQDYITYQHQTVEVAQQMILWDLEKCFCKSHSSFKKFGFPAPRRIPTELEEALLHWKTDNAKEWQGLLLQSLNVTVTNNPEQQLAFDTIMESIDHMVEAGQDKMTSHVCHIITGPGGTGKTPVFRKLHAACWAKGLLISICSATGLAALLFNGATTAHSLFNYLVEEEDDVNDQDCPQCNFNKQRSDFLKEVSVIFWDEFISNDWMLMEAVLQEFKTKWGIPCYYVFICAGDFAQVSVVSIMCAVNVEVPLLLLIFVNRFFPSFAATKS